MIECHHLPPGQRIERARVGVLVPLIPGEGCVDGDDLAVPRSRGDIIQKSSETWQLLIRKLRQRGAESRPINGEDSEIERLERPRSDQQEGRQRQYALPLQTAISLTLPSTISFGSVISCTCSGVTPGATSISFNPRSETSITQ